MDKEELLTHQVALDMIQGALEAIYPVFDQPDIRQRVLGLALIEAVVATRAIDPATHLTVVTGLVSELTQDQKTFVANVLRPAMAKELN